MTSFHRFMRCAARLTAVASMALVSITSAEPPRTLAPPATPLGGSTEINSIRDDLNRSKWEEADRIRELRDKMRRLSQIHARRRQMRKAAEPPAAAPRLRTPAIEVQPTLPLPLPKTSPAPPDIGQSPKPEPPPQPSIPATKPPANETALPTTGPDEAAIPDEPVVPPTLVTEGAVDRMSLANNLFAIGEFELALQTYESLDPAVYSEKDRQWIDYQRACAHRRLGDLEAAKKMYRVLVSQDDAGTLGTAARWWLEHIERKAELERRMANLKAVLKNVRRALDDNPR